jgi:TMEM175 potassium channel family protein
MMPAMEAASVREGIGPESDASRTKNRRGPERLEAFSDGVFAIAITLLVLEIRVPEGEVLADPGHLIAALGNLWPSYLGYAISFITVGIIWANHHNLIRLVASVDHGLILANLGLLLVVGFVPFPTALLAGTLGTPSAQVGVRVYAGTFGALAVAFNILWSWIRRGEGVLRADVSARSIAAISRSYRLGPPGFAAAFIGGLVNPALGMAILIGLVALYTLPSSSGV